MELKEFLWSLIIIYISARLFAELVSRVGQPAVLGELLAGVLIGGSVLGLVEETQILTLLGQIGVMLLLFEIGLESDIRSFLKVGWSAAGAAVLGVAAPFLLGYGVALGLGLTPLQAMFIGAALTPTSVSIPARVLSDMGRLKTKEGNILLGAAVVDDILALVALSVMAGLLESGSVTWTEIGTTVGIALGFLGAAIVIGIRFAHLFSKLMHRMSTRGGIIVTALTFALLLGDIAKILHLAPLVGAFAAGLVLARTEHRLHIEKRIKPVADVFVPIFFVLVGMAVDLSELNPLDRENWSVLMLAGGLALAAIAGKLVAGLGVGGKRVNRWTVGVGMVPRGEVVLIFASLGLSSGLIGQAEYGALLIVVFVSTFLPPMVLKQFSR